VLGGLLVIGLLLWPDLSELGVPGFLTLKRTVEEQQHVVAEQKEQIKELQVSLQQFQNVEQTVDQRSEHHSTATNINMIDVAKLSESVDRKVAEYRRIEAVSSDTRVVEDRKLEELLFGTASPKRAELEGQLLRLWVKLRPLADLKLAPEAKLRLWIMTVNSPLVEAIAEWKRFFGPELDLIREAHYLVSNGIPIEDEQLEAAVTVARQILSILIDKLEAIGVPPEVWKQMGSTPKAREEAARLRTQRMQRVQEKASKPIFGSIFTNTKEKSKEAAKTDEPQADK
jgi:hypothetical protein